jgi:hypothetical protein
LRHILSPAVAALRVEVVPLAARRGSKGRRAATPKDFSQRVLYDDAGAAGLHGAGMPLEGLDLGAAVAQGQAGAQTANRPPATTARKPLNLSFGIDYRSSAIGSVLSR